MSRTPTLGAPGIYRLPKEPVRSLFPERMDICAFAGVTERGPARFPLYLPRPAWMTPPEEDTDAEHGSSLSPQRRSVAVPVQSWAEFERLYGGYAGPGRLPYAVAAFFQNGGVRAWVVRVVEPQPGFDRFARCSCPAITASGAPIVFYARDPGSWGNQLALKLELDVSPLPFESATVTKLVVDPTLEVLPGALLRLRYPGGRALRFAVAQRKTLQGDLELELSEPLLAVPGSAELVEGRLSAGEGNFDSGRVEEHLKLGFSSLHPRWLGKVLYEESSLLLAAPEWADDDLTLDPALAPVELGPQLKDPTSSRQFTLGEDDYPVLTPEAFFGSWVPGDSVDYQGVHCLVENEEIALLCVPDLYEPEPLAPLGEVAPDGGAGPAFADCVPLGPVQPVPPNADLPLLHLDPLLDFEQIVSLQSRLVELAEQLRGPVVLLDVPPRLQLKQILQWRTRFDSAFAAAYHPWVKVPPQDERRDALVLLNPSAVAAGIIAKVGLGFGVPFGPANVIAGGVVDLAAQVTPPEHDRLHPAGINVYLFERDGARLTAARTLSRDPSFRQLSVRRLLTQLERTLTHQMQWVVFEPNGRKLRQDLTRMLTELLSGLYRGGAFTGANESEAFFVKCDDELNPERAVDEGRLLAHVGVAPAEPLEFIVLTVAVEAGVISVEA